MDRPKPIPEKVKDLLAYDAETGLLCWKVNMTSRARAGQIAGCIGGRGYRLIGIDGMLYTAHHLAWFLHHGRQASEFLDHINRVRDDNRIVNLREASHRDNMNNVSLQKRNKTGVQCVRPWKNGRYRAVVRGVHLGLFDSLDEAAAAVTAVR